MLKVHNLSFKYSNNKDLILSNIRTSVNEGDILAVIGPSGGGKSTLLRLISGLEMPLSGKIEIDGLDVTHLAPEKRSIGMLFQDYALFPHMTVEKNIAYGLKEKGKAKSDRIAQMLDIVSMKGYEKRYPHELSGGQQQRIALARTLAPEPKILLLDEPFSNLDSDLQAKLRKEIFEIVKSLNITTIIVTHNKDDATYANHTIRIADGAETQKLIKNSTNNC